jgi:hypothetical protein
MQNKWNKATRDKIEKQNKSRKWLKKIKHDKWKKSKKDEIGKQF